MITTRADGITLAYEAQDQPTAEILRATCARVIPLAAERWGLKPPKDLYVYLMTEHWVRDIHAALPWYWRPFFYLSLPLWYLRLRKMFPYIGGWQQHAGRRRVIGIKPPHMLEKSDRSLGERIFIKEPDMQVKVGHLLCHELTHAFTSHLRLPAWLNEGLAMVTVDAFLGKPSVLPETVQALRKMQGKPGDSSYLTVYTRDLTGVVYLYVRGYWITRYLEATHPGLLKELLQRRRSHGDLETRLARGLYDGEHRQDAGWDGRRQFWREIDGRVVDFFQSTNEERAANEPEPVERSTG